jgi:uncharacterized protein YjbI with pentapeptide repeats
MIATITGILNNIILLKLINLHLPSSEFRQWVGVISTPLTLIMIALFVTQRLAIGERKLSTQQGRQDALKNYFDTMTRLLVDKDLASQDHENTISQAAKAITLAVLRELDHERRIQLIEFLNDARLIQNVSLDSCGPSLLRGANLTGLDLRGVNLKEVDLSKANLSKANLSGANLINSNLHKANFCEAILKNAYLDKANLRESFLWKAQLDKAILQEANLENARMDEASLRGALLDRAKLSGVQGSDTATREILESEAVSIFFQETGIRKFIIWRFFLLGFSFKMWRIKGADLRGASLHDALIRGANLEHCNLEEARLMGADLTQANLNCAKLSRASLVGSDLRDSSLSQAALRSVLYDKTTSFPEDFDPRKHGMINIDTYEPWWRFFDFLWY